MHQASLSARNAHLTELLRQVAWMPKRATWPSASKECSRTNCIIA
jgi:hypothetical protein